MILIFDDILFLILVKKFATAMEVLVWRATLLATHATVVVHSGPVHPV